MPLKYSLLSDTILSSDSLFIIEMIVKDVLVVEMSLVATSWIWFLIYVECLEDVCVEAEASLGQPSCI